MSVLVPMSVLVMVCVFLMSPGFRCFPINFLIETLAPAQESENVCAFERVRVLVRVCACVMTCRSECAL